MTRTKKTAALTSAPVAPVETLIVAPVAIIEVPAEQAPQQAPQQAPEQAPAEQAPAASFVARRTVLSAMLQRLQDKNPKGGKDVRNMLGQGRGGDTHKHALTPVVNGAIDALCAEGVSVDAIFAPGVNPKVTMRFIQFVNAITAREFKNIDPTSAKILYAMKLAGDYPLTTDALAYIVSGKLGAGKTSPESRGVSTRVVARLFGNVGLTTAPTQISRSVGDNGFMQLCGMTHGDAGKQNRAYKLRPSHPLVSEFFAVVERATDSQLDDMVKSKEEETA